MNVDVSDRLGQFGSILRRVGDILFRAANADAEGRPWTRGYLDVRSGPTGDARLAKWRVVLADGQTLTELDVARGVASLLTEAYDLRDELFEDQMWYGVLLTVYPDGRHEVEFDYDPLCVTKGFFDS